MLHLFFANSKHAAGEAVHSLLLAVNGLALDDDGTQQHSQGARMGNCAALVRGNVPIERVLQTDALDEMIDQRQRAQSLALQGEANHCACPSQYLALVLATDDKSQPLHRLTRRRNMPPESI
jgi:hypothetical protein